MSMISSIAELEALYADSPLAAASTVKVTDHVTADYAAIIAASPFCALATRGPEGLDCSPRGDQPGFVRVHNPQTLLMPDRRGNNRIDSLRNIVRDPSVALLFLIPGVGTTLRVNGKARLSAARDMLDVFAVGEARPRSVIVVSVGEVYFQCARAIVRSKLWDNASRVDPASLPSPGRILSTLTQRAIDGDAYDRDWPERAARSLW